MLCACFRGFLAVPILFRLAVILAAGGLCVGVKNFGSSNKSNSWGWWRIEDEQDCFRSGKVQGDY